MNHFMRQTTTILSSVPKYIVHVESAEPSLQNQLPEYLKDLFSQSAVNVNKIPKS